MHLLEGRLVQRPRQVDAVHLGADGGVSFSILISDWGMRASFSLSDPAPAGFAASR